MSEVQFGKRVTLEQAAQLIATNPRQRFHLRGEPGIGKSSLLRIIADKLGYDYAYIDTPTLDLGDVAMPVVDREFGVTRYYPNARFKLHERKPLVIMLDEISKATPTVRNMLHPMLEKSNPRLGDIPLTDETIVFTTGNNSTDGVGDNLLAHTLNRMVVLEIEKPSTDAWIKWALNNGIAPELVLYVEKTPEVMASYRDPGQQDNHRIFNPKRPQAAYASPRSLATASDIIQSRHLNDPDAVIAALSGTIGEACARELMAFLQFSDQLPAWEAVIAAPTRTAIPSSPGAMAIMCYGAVTKVTHESMDAWMQYLERSSPEWQSIFAINVAKNPAKQAVAFKCRRFAEWVAKNQDLL